MTVSEITRIVQMKKLTADLQEYHDELDERITAKENDVRLLLIRLLSLNHFVPHKTPTPTSDKDNRVNREEECDTNEKESIESYCQEIRRKITHDEHSYVSDNNNKEFINSIKQKTAADIDCDIDEENNDNYGYDDSVMCNVTKEQSIILPETVKTKNSNPIKINNNVMSKSPIIVKSNRSSESLLSPIELERQSGSNTFLRKTNNKEESELIMETRENKNRKVCDKNRKFIYNSNVSCRKQTEILSLPQTSRWNARPRNKRVRFSSKSPQVSTYSCERASTISPMYSTVNNNIINKNRNYTKNVYSYSKNNYNNNKCSYSYVNASITSTINDTNCANIECSRKRNHIVVADEEKKNKHFVETENSFNSFRELITSAREASPRSSVNVYLNCVAQMRSSLELHNDKKSKYDKQAINWQEKLSSCELCPDVDQETNAGTPTMPSSLPASTLPIPESVEVIKTWSEHEQCNNSHVKTISSATSTNAALQSCLADDTKEQENVKRINNLTTRKTNNASKFSFITQRHQNVDGTRQSINYTQEKELEKEWWKVEQPLKIVTANDKLNDRVNCHNRENLEYHNNNKYDDVHSSCSINEEFTAPAMWVQRRRCKSIVESTPSFTVHSRHLNKLKANTYNKKSEERKEEREQCYCNNKTSIEKMTNDDSVLLPQSAAMRSEGTTAVKIEEKHNVLTFEKLSQSNNVLNKHYNIELACGPTLYFDESSHNQ